MKLGSWLIACAVLAATGNPATAKGRKPKAEPEPQPEVDGPSGGIGQGAYAINSLGLALLRRGFPSDQNAFFSPYSIQVSLAMLFAGARGTTRDEMAKALQYPESGKSIHSSLSLISGTVRELLRMSAEDRSGQYLGKAPLTISVANRLFARRATEFAPEFLAVLDKTYQASPGQVDFAGGPAGVTAAINRWVAEEARRGIGEVVPPSALDSSTGLVVVSAIDLKMAWVDAFVPSGTMPFFLNANRIAEVAAFQVMANEAEYERRELYVAITVPVAAPYEGPDLQLIILLPHKGI